MSEFIFVFLAPPEKWDDDTFFTPPWDKEGMENKIERQNLARFIDEEFERPLTGTQDEYILIVTRSSVFRFFTTR